MPAGSHICILNCLSTHTPTLRSLQLSAMWFLNSPHPWVPSLKRQLGSSSYVCVCVSVSVCVRDRDQLLCHVKWLFYPLVGWLTTDGMDNDRRQMVCDWLGFRTNQIGEKEREKKKGVQTVRILLYMSSRWLLPVYTYYVVVLCTSKNRWTQNQNPRVR